MGSKNSQENKDPIEIVSDDESEESTDFFSKCDQIRSKLSLQIVDRVMHFTNKHSKADTDIMLNENEELLLKDKYVADTFNEYFRSIVESLDLYK